MRGRGLGVELTGLRVEVWGLGVEVRWISGVAQLVYQRPPSREQAGLFFLPVARQYWLVIDSLLSVIALISERRRRDRLRSLSVGWFISPLFGAPNLSRASGPCSDRKLVQSRGPVPVEPPSQPDSHGSQSV